MIEHVGDMVGVSLNLINGLEFICLAFNSYYCLIQVFNFSALHLIPTTI